MSEFIVFTLLGLGVGAMYALSAIGVVLVYRSSGVVNVSAGAAGMVGAYAWWELAANGGTPIGVAVLAGLVVSALVGGLTFLLAIRPLSKASTLAKVVSTLGVLTVLQAATTLRFGTEPKMPKSILPRGVVSLNGARIPDADLYLIGISIVLTAVLWAVYRYTRFGLATSALAQSQLGLEALGFRADLVGCVNWILGGALAGFSGIFLASLSPISPGLGTAIIVPVLASAVVGGMSSFPLACAGAMTIGAIQSDLGNYVNVPGISDVVPLAIVVLLLTVRGGALPQRSFTAERLPKVQGRSLPIGWIVATTVVVSLIVDVWLPVSWVLATTTTCGAGLVLLSLVLVTGYGGQISLAQFALAGVGGLVAAHALSAHVPLLATLALSVLVILPISIIVGLPASRSRGMSLAIATLCLSQVLVSTLLNNTHLIGGYNGLTIGTLRIFGINISPALYPRRYAIFALGVLAVAAVLVCNIRRGRIGRQLLAVRGNERAAASVGISVVTTKLSAFAYGGMIAALGGVLLVLQNPVATFSYFNVTSSIQYAAWAVIGGVGYAAGSVMGAGFQQGSLGTQVFNSLLGSTYFNWITLVGGVLVVLTLVQSPNGLVPQNLAMAAAIRRRSRATYKAKGTVGVEFAADALDGSIASHLVGKSDLSAGETATPSMKPGVAECSSIHTLTVEKITVRLGGVTALDSVSFELRSGEVLGVMGPNGAGKTTLIDVVTGFVRLSEGRVLVDGEDVSTWTPQRRMRGGVSRSFQSVELFDQLTIRENLLTASFRGSRTDWVSDVVWPSRARLTAAELNVVRTLSLEESLDQLPEELSFGARRAVAVARAVAASPRIVLLDEPAAGLNDTEREQLSTIIRWLAEDLQVAVLLVEHDVALVAKVSDQILALDRGQVVTSGEPDEVLRDRRVVASYIGAEPDLADELIVEAEEIRR